MTAFMAQMLDELMGTGRNSVDGASKVSFENPEVCKFALAGFCPREAFRNTKMDFGQCAQRHDECFKEEYKRSSRFGKLGYEELFMRRIREINREIQRKIDKNTDRLNSGCLPGVEGVTTKYDEQLANLTRQIDENMNKGQLMCEAGQVTEGQELLKEAEELQAVREELEQKRIVSIRHVAGIAMDLSRPMHVCAECGCFMLTTDAQCRIDDHLAGKLHTTCARIRQILKEEREKQENVDSDKDGDEVIFCAVVFAHLAAVAIETPAVDMTAGASTRKVAARGAAAAVPHAVAAMSVTDATAMLVMPAALGATNRSRLLHKLLR
ncbi:unnamed protein product, partial [Mesorhabditis spiculigera]